MRDPVTFLNCPRGTTAEASGSGVCCKADGACVASANAENGFMKVPDAGILVKTAISFGMLTSFSSLPLCPFPLPFTFHPLKWSAI